MAELNQDEESFNDGDEEAKLANLTKAKGKKKKGGGGGQVNKAVAATQPRTPKAAAEAKTTMDKARSRGAGPQGALDSDGPARAPIT